MSDRPGRSGEVYVGRNRMFRENKWRVLAQGYQGHHQGGVYRCIDENYSRGRGYLKVIDA